VPAKRDTLRPRTDGLSDVAKNARSFAFRIAIYWPETEGIGMLPGEKANTRHLIEELAMAQKAAGDMARFTHAQVANKLQLETQLFNLVGPQLVSMGHKASAAGGGIAGGYQGIMFVPNPNGGPELSTCGNEQADCGVNGFYRAGSNVREDGDSIGW